MSGPDPFVPPADAIQPPPAELPPPSPATFQGLLSTSAAIASPPRSRPRWLLPVTIVVAAVIFAAVAGGVAAVLLSTLPRIFDTVASGPSVSDDEAEWTDYIPADELLAGDPGSPLADSPLDCEGCFSAADAKALQLDDTIYEQLGLTEGIGTPFSLRLAHVQAQTIEWWRADEMAPDTCYALYSAGPTPMTPVELDRDDPSFIETVVTKPDRLDLGGFYAARTSIRVFTDSSGAVTHMTDLVDAIDGCHGFSSGMVPTSTLTVAPALDLPADVGGYTWAEDTDGIWRYYGADLQRGNLVVRLSMNSDGYGPTEGEFRAFVEEYALQLSAAVPSG